MRLITIVVFLAATLSYAKATQRFYSLDEVSTLDEPSWWTYFTLYGDDKDSNGIRDDVQNWILAEFDDINLKRAFLLLAYYHNKLIEHTFHPKEFKKNYKRVLQLEGCIQLFLAFKQRREPHPLALIETKIYNNPLRRQMRWFGNALLDDDERYLNILSFEKVLPQCGFRIHRLDLFFDIMRRSGKSNINKVSNEKLKNLLEKLGEK